MLRSDLCDCCDADIVVERDITVAGANHRDKHSRNLVLQNNTPFISCISKIINTLVNNAEDLDIVMHMYNLIEYSKNYSNTSGALWSYYKYISADPITYSESFKYKKSTTGKTANNGNTKRLKFYVPLKYFSNFSKILDKLLINCELSLTLTWSKNCVLPDVTTTDTQ